MTIKEGRRRPDDFFNHVFGNGITIGDLDRHRLEFGGHYALGEIQFRITPCINDRKLVIGVEVLEETHADPVIAAIRG